VSSTGQFWVAMAGIIATFITTVLGMVLSRNRTNVVSAKVDDVHTLVNSNLTAAQDRNEQLTAALTAGNVNVPISPAVPPQAS
jgi:hypothetical protein